MAWFGCHGFAVLGLCLRFAVCGLLWLGLAWLAIGRLGLAWLSGMVWFAWFVVAAWPVFAQFGACLPYPDWFGLASHGLLGRLRLALLPLHRLACGGARPGLAKPGMAWAWLLLACIGLAWPNVAWLALPQLGLACIAWLPPVCLGLVWLCRPRTG